MSKKKLPESLQRGVDLILDYVRDLPDSPGVYRMLDEKDEVLYVGKAKSLKKRVRNYATINGLSLRIQRMIARTHKMVFVHTHTEAEALLLESNLIKKLKPVFNVLLRDDKSFPYILLTGDHDFPLLTKHRGAQKREGDYFGPFASVSAVNKTLTVIQKAFMLRNCSDNVFEQRTRPCLQYHIKRCTAPCVGHASKEEYQAQVDDAKAFLSGRSQEIQDRFASLMQEASDKTDFEEAARYRDRIRALTKIQARQDINISGLEDSDVIALYRDGSQSCIQVFFFRGGQNFGNRAYFPRHNDEDSDENILLAFTAQFYNSKPIPPTVIVSLKPEARNKAVLEEALTIKRKSGSVKIQTPQRGQRKSLVTFAIDNARRTLRQEINKKTRDKTILKELEDLFEIDSDIERIEVFDNSHTGGQNMVGAMIVAGQDGFQKSAYRKFNIKEADESDDYGMMREVMQRRFSRAMKEGNGPDSPEWPDILLIDGGLGQLNAVYDVLDDIGISEDLAVVSIAKGEDRNAGREVFFMRGRPSFSIKMDSPALHYLQRLRDEAHRFAISAHRSRRSKAMSGSALDDIPGIGAKRKKALLHYFGSVKSIERAGLKDLMKVDGVSEMMAQTIYDYFHDAAS